MGPDQFDLSATYGERDPSGNVICGCAMGWSTTVFQECSQDSDWRGFLEIATDVFGISKEHGSSLFASGCMPDGAGGKRYPPTGAGIAALIEAYCDWHEAGRPEPEASRTLQEIASTTPVVPRRITVPRLRAEAPIEQEPALV